MLDPPFMQNIFKLFYICILLLLLLLYKSCLSRLSPLQAKGFELSYLEKVTEVKDTVHRQSLLHHCCNFVVEKFPDTTDVYSEIAAITRSAKVGLAGRPKSKERVVHVSLICLWVSRFASYLLGGL